MTWVKQRSGNHRQFHSNAYYTVHTKEMIMVGVKGTPRCEWNSKISNVFFAVRDGHNQKPDAIHEIVEKLFGVASLLRFLHVATISVLGGYLLEMNFELNFGFWILNLKCPIRKRKNNNFLSIFLFKNNFHNF